MTTAAEVKRLLKPVLAKHDDLVLVGRFLLIKPVWHVARGIYFDQTSRRDKFTVYATTVFLGQNRDGFDLGQSAQFSAPNSHSWSFSEPRTPQWLDGCVDGLLRALRGVVSVETYAACQ